MDQTVFAMIFVIIFCGAMILIGLYYNKKKAAKNSDDYILAGREAPLIIVVGSYFATSVSTGSLVGYAGMGFSQGISGYWNAAAFMIATMWIGLWIIPRLRRAGVITIPELFEKYFGAPHRVTAVLLAMCRDLGVISGIVLVLGQIFQTLFGMSFWPSVLLTAAIVLIFTITGGMWAVLVTDTIQAVLICVGTLIMVPFGIARLGGGEAFVSQVPANLADPLGVGIKQALGWFFIGLFTSLANQTILQRGLAAKDDKTAQRAFFWGGLVTLVWFLIPFVIGIIAKVSFPGEKSSNAYYSMAQLFGPIGNVFFLSILLMAGMSTVSSNLLTSCSNLSLDIYKRFFAPDVTEKRLLSVQRILLVILIAVCIFVSKSFPYAVELFTTGGRILAAGLAPVLTSLILWKRSRRAPFACLAAMVGGAVSCVGAQLYQAAHAAGSAAQGAVVLLWTLDPILAGLPICLIILIAGVWLETSRQTPEYLAKHAVRQN
ncbi:MAG: sodium:solute symporter family protein [Synergistaceae bacterium]|nr:sodium:solute symporter family protein [Synergistaceae bacterium]